MRRTTAWWIAAAGVMLVVFASRWPFRSEALFSWDSANFALGMDRIDLAAHRPHPPGYLGYVFAARLINLVVHDSNTALAVWNMLATGLAAIVLGTFAWQAADRERRTLSAIAVVALVLTSPAVWFYGEIAEIYASELLFSSLVAYTAWRAVNGEDRLIYWCLGALALAAFFKIVTAVFLAPLVFFAWTRVAQPHRRRAASIVGSALVAAVAVTFAARPDIYALAWQTASESRWLFRGELVNPMLMFNRNLRDTLTGAIVVLGVVNFAALLVWAASDRRLPGIGRTVALLWLLPGLLVFVFVLIAKPGYLLPLLPIAALVIGLYYARLPRAVAIGCIAAQAAINVLHFVALTPFTPQMVGGTARYRDKTLVQKALSDLQGVATPTAYTIAQSDRRLRALMATVSTSCPDRTPVIVAGPDWRRVMWYLPAATAIHVVNGHVDYIGQQTESTPVPAEGREVQTSCPVVWVALDDGTEAFKRPEMPSAAIPLVGWTTEPTTLRVTRDSLEPVRP